MKTIAAVLTSTFTFLIGVWVFALFQSEFMRPSYFGWGVGVFVYAFIALATVKATCRVFMWMRE